MSCRTVLLALVFVAPVAAEDWPGWRGPRGDGSSKEKDIPLKVGPTDRVRWSAPIAGTGFSSPVVVGDRIFLTTCIEKEGETDAERVLICLDRRTGEEAWRKVVVKAPLERKHSLNSYASATPVTDGERVYVSFLDKAEMQVACFSVDGTRKLWQKSPGKLLSVHGFCSSPILHGDLVILNGDQDAKAYLVGLDKKTGEEKWRADRPKRTRSYCTPILIPCPIRKGITQLVLSGSRCVTGYDADTGKLLWIIDGPTEQYVASLVYHRGILFLTTGFPEFHLMGIRPDGEGNITGTEHIAWHIPHAENKAKGAAYVPSPCAHDGYFFVVSDAGYLGCVEAKTGKRVYLEKLGRRHSASPILVEGNLIIPDDDGKVWVVKASPKFGVVETNDMKDPIFASPVTAHGELFLRTTKKLYCIGGRAKAGVSTR